MTAVVTGTGIVVVTETGIAVVTGTGITVVGIITEVGIIETEVGVIVASIVARGLGNFLQPHRLILFAIDSFLLITADFTTLLTSVTSSTKIH